MRILYKNLKICFTNIFIKTSTVFNYCRKSIKLHAVLLAAFAAAAIFTGIKIETGFKTLAAEETPETAQISVKEHFLSTDSKYINYLWNDKQSAVPDAKVYIFEPSDFNGHTVCIDPGHGDNSHPAATLKKEKVYPVADEMLAGMNTSMKGKKAFDFGVEARDYKNVYDNNETEPEYTLKVALLVKDKLLAKGYRVVLTRTEYNQNLSNGARAVLAGETSDIMIAIHTNASDKRGVRGTMAFYPGDNDFMDGTLHPGYTKIMGIEQNAPSSQKLASLLADNVSKSAGFKNLGSHSAVLRIFSYSSIPVSLVEVGFSDQIDDARILIEKKNEAAEGIVKSVDEYFSN